MSRLVKLMVFGLLFLGIFVSASFSQPISSRFVDPRLECAKPTYDVGVRWMCVQNVTPIPSQPDFWVCYFGQAGIPNYPIPGPGGYNSWKVRLTGIDEGAAYHTASFDCYHDTSEDSKRVVESGFDLTDSKSSSGGGLDYADESWQLVATVEVDAGSYSSGDWVAAGCPNIGYMYYAFDDGVAQAQVYIAWFDGKQSPSQVSAPVSSSKSSSPRVFVRSSVSRVSSVLAKASSYFRQRAFKR